MNNRLLLRAAVLAACGVLGLSACGGGSGGSGNNNTNTTPPKLVSGVITGFGSVYVNGVRYVTDDATIVINGQTVPETDLEVGMRVDLQGSLTGTGIGVAQEVSFSNSILGEVVENTLAIGATTGVIKVMGLDVTINSKTVVAGITDANGVTDLSVLTPGQDIVEVSGYPDGSGGFVASRIALKAGVTTREIKGVVQNFVAGQSFEIGSLKVNLSGGALSLPASLGNGLYVKVESNAAPTVVNAVYELAPSSVSLQDGGVFGVSGEDGEEVEVQGIVTKDASGNYYLNGQSMVIDTAAGDEDGMDPAQMALTLDGMANTGVAVKIEATLNAQRQLVVQEVEAGKNSEIELEGTITVDTAAQTISILGKTVTTTAATIVVDDYQDLHYFNFSNLAGGDYVEVSAYQDQATGQLVALKLQRDTPRTTSKIKGLVTAGGIVPEVAGIRVSATGVNFDTAMANGDVVKVRGTWDSGTGVLTGTAEIDH